MTKNRFTTCLLVFFTLLAGTSAHAQRVYSLGLFTGLAIPYTWDDGISSDPRYRTRFDIKFSAIGVHYGIDNEGHGFSIDPSLLHIGQNFNVLNDVSGEIGKRTIDLRYVQIPASIKLHVIDMSFFKVSFVGSVGVGLLLDGEETIDHRSGEVLKFPIEMTGSTSDPDQTRVQEFEAMYPNYTVVAGGVTAASPVKGKLSTKDDFQKIQFFGALGLRSDWDFSDNWRASFDLRANIGILEPRTADYTDRIKNYQALYDIYGNRRELFLSLTFGIARTVMVEKRKETMRPSQFENKARKPTVYSKPRSKSKNKKRKG